jgi:hypothetical protein
LERVGQNKGGTDRKPPSLRSPPRYVTLHASRHELEERHRQEERQERRIAYHRYLSLFNTLDSDATCYRPESDATLKQTLHEYNDAVAAVDLYGTAEVRAALNEARRLNRHVGELMASPASSAQTLVDTFVTAWIAVRAGQ